MSESGPDSDFTLIVGSSLLVSCDKIECACISGYEIVKLIIEDKTIDFISSVDSNMHASTIAIGEAYT